MAGLSNVDIERRLREEIPEKRLEIKPLEESQIGPGSVDLTLGNQVGVTRKSAFPYIDPRRRETVENMMELLVFRNDQELWLQPKEVVIWLSKEYLKLPHDLKGFIFPRSSWMQLFIDTTGFVDAGFEGQLIIEVVNNHVVPVVLRPGDRICQIVFLEDKTPSTKPYKGKYKGRDHIEPSKVWRDYLKP